MCISSKVRRVFARIKDKKASAEIIGSLLSCCGRAQYFGVVYSAKGYDDAGIKRLFHSVYPEQKQVKGKVNGKPVTLYTSLWRKVLGVHQWCKTPFRLTLMTCSRLALHHIVEVGLRSVQGEYEDTETGLNKLLKPSIVQLRTLRSTCEEARKDIENTRKELAHTKKEQETIRKELDRTRKEEKEKSEKLAATIKALEKLMKEQEKMKKELDELKEAQSRDNKN